MTTKKISPRINFATIDNQVDYPDFLDIQLKSFQSFFQTGTTLDERRNEGLYKTFTELFPITDSRNNFVLEFIDYLVDPPRYSIEECIDRGLTFKVPLKVKLKNLEPSPLDLLIYFEVIACLYARNHITGFRLTVIWRTHKL